MYGITSLPPVLFSWNAAITHLAQDVSLCPLLEPWATLQSVVLSCLGCRFAACLYILPILCVLQLTFGETVYTRSNLSASHLCYKTRREKIPSYMCENFEKESILSS